MSQECTRWTPAGFILDAGKEQSVDYGRSRTAGASSVVRKLLHRPTLFNARHLG